MKIYYRISKEGIINVPNDVWEEMQKDYRGDVMNFARVTVQEELGDYDDDGLTVTKIDMGQ